MAQTLNAKVHVPSWVRWIAVDANGEVRGYKYKPLHGKGFSYGQWTTDFAGMAYGNHCFLYKGLKPKNWKTELYAWG